MAIRADTECYKNYWLCAFKDKATGKVVYFEKFNDKKTEGSIDEAVLKKIMARKTTYWFNGIGYDMAMVYAAITGVSNQTLKAISDAIIVGKMKYWEVCRQWEFFIPRDIDLIDVMDVAPGQAGLKIYAGRLNAPEMQDLPYEPDTVLTWEQACEVRKYCIKDLNNTGLLADKLADRIALREKMSKEYGTDLRSKSDAQIAETVIKHEIEKLTGVKLFRPIIAPGTTFKYKPPTYLKFKTKLMKEVFQTVLDADFVVDKNGKVEVPASFAGLDIRIGSSKYTLQIGGLHSCESKVSHYATKKRKLKDADVGSYYPEIIVKNGFYPQHLGKVFYSTYSAVLTRRLAAKAAKDKVTDSVLKIVLNSSFGKFGSMWSALFAPDLMIQVTITGQLSLLMLIEQLELAGISVVSANTDGIVSSIPVELESKYEQICNWWMDTTRYKLEYTDYSSIHSASVNSYIAVKYDGSVKLKGDFADNELCKEPYDGLSTNPANQICVEAVVNYITKGTSIEETISGCTDITRFVTVTKVNGGAVDCNGELIGKVLRWYYSTNSTGPFRRVGNGNKVPVSDGAKPLMDLPESFPTDIDYKWYIAKAHGIMADIGYAANNYIDDLF